MTLLQKVSQAAVSTGRVVVGVNQRVLIVAKPWRASLQGSAVLVLVTWAVTLFAVLRVVSLCLLSMVIVLKPWRASLQGSAVLMLVVWVVTLFAVLLCPSLDPTRFAVWLLVAMVAYIASSRVAVMSLATTLRGVVVPVLVDMGAPLSR